MRHFNSLPPSWLHIIIKIANGHVGDGVITCDVIISQFVSTANATPTLLTSANQWTASIKVLWLLMLRGNGVMAREKEMIVISLNSTPVKLDSIRLH